MNTAISTLEIPQGATELTLNELKLICGGNDDECETAARRRRLRLEKVIVIKVFKRKHRRSSEDCNSGDES